MKKQDLKQLLATGTSKLKTFNERSTAGALKFNSEHPNVAKGLMAANAVFNLYTLKNKGLSKLVKMIVVHNSLVKGAAFFNTTGAQEQTTFNDETNGLKVTGAAKDVEMFQIYVAKAEALSRKLSERDVKSVNTQALASKFFKDGARATKVQGMASGLDKVANDALNSGRMSQLGVYMQKLKEVSSRMTIEPLTPPKNASTLKMGGR